MRGRSTAGPPPPAKWKRRANKIEHPYGGMRFAFPPYIFRDADLNSPLKSVIAIGAGSSSGWPGVLSGLPRNMIFGQHKLHRLTAEMRKQHVIHECRRYIDATSGDAAVVPF